MQAFAAETMPTYDNEEAFTHEDIRDRLAVAATGFVANLMEIFDPMVSAYAAKTTAAPETEDMLEDGLESEDSESSEDEPEQPGVNEGNADDETDYTYSHRNQATATTSSNGLGDW